MDDPRHQHIRRLVTPTLSPRRLRDLEHALTERCDAILDAAVARGQCDFLVDVAAELPLQAIASLLGVPHDDRHRFMDWADTTLDYTDRDPGETTPRVQEASAAMFSYGVDLLSEKQRCPVDDLLSIVATATLPDGGPLTDLEQQMFFNLLIAAGTETTRNTITAGVLALIERPDQWAALRSDRSLMPAAVEEMLRWASSTIYNRRTATTAIERHGQTVRPGDKVVLWWQSGNFDERAFAEPSPLAFDIRRAPNPHLAFGTGTHFCLGANLARLEIRLVLAGLLARVAEIVPTGPVERTRSNKHAGFRHAPVQLVPLPR
jgi:cytochrome P450